MADETRVVRESTPRGRAALTALLLLVAGAVGAGERLLVEAGDSPVLGAPAAPITVIEFVDYQ